MKFGASEFKVGIAASDSSRNPAMLSFALEWDSGRAYKAGTPLLVIVTSLQTG